MRTLVAFFLLASTANAANSPTIPVIYHWLDNNYFVHGTFIQTNGAPNPQTVADIVDYRFTVFHYDGGLQPPHVFYEFTPTSGVHRTIEITGQAPSVSRSHYGLFRVTDPAAGPNIFKVSVDADGDNVFENNLTYFSGANALPGGGVQMETYVSLHVVTQQGTVDTKANTPGPGLFIAAAPEPPAWLLAVIGLTLLPSVRARKGVRSLFSAPLH